MDSPLPSFFLLFKLLHLEDKHCELRVTRNINFKQFYVDMSDEIVVYGLADGSEPAGKGFEPYEEAAVSLKPGWINMEDDSISTDQLLTESSETGDYIVTVAENYEAFLNDDIMPVAVRYREHNTPQGSPGTVLTYPGSDISDLGDLEEATVAVEEVNKGTTMAFLAAAEAQGYDPNSFDLTEVPEDEAPEMPERGELDAAILDSDDWLTGEYGEVFNFNQVLENRYGEVPPAQIWVTDRDSYFENPEVFDDFDQWGKSVRDHVDERMSNSSDLTPEEQRKIDMHTRFDEFRPQDAEAIEDITEIADKVA